MYTEYYYDASGFDALAAEWNNLLARSVSNTIFLTWEWQTTWWRHMGEDELCILAVRDEEGTLVGLAPLYREERASRDGVLSVVGCRDISDYLDLIVARSLERPVYEAIAAALASKHVLPWEALDFCNLPSASPTRTLLAEVAQAHGWTAAVELEDVCPMIELPGSWEEFLLRLDKKQRHEIRRKIRRLELEAESRWYIIGLDDDLDSAVNTFIHLHELSSQEKDAFMDERMQGFFRDVAHVLHHRGWLQLAFLEINGIPAASMWNFDYGDAILVYNSGYNPRYASLSPGIVCLTRCIEHAIRLGRAQFDFMRGEEEYKFRFGAVPRHTYRLLIERQSEA